jgi:alkanesulfonate monooxygenase SsuD/methylene tetrahydromethanopterin reductase-like flavin-dependent oxidoreductase (luciferase family)
MGSSTGLLHLGVVLDGAGCHPAAWRAPEAERPRLFEPGYLVDLARQAERGRLDFVVADDAFPSGDPRPDRVTARLDAVLALARVAPATESIGLIATVTTTHTEPFHVSKNIATLDHVSGGRAGWRVAVSTTDDEARLFGRKPAATPAEAYAEASETADVVTRLWDSWEDDAVIRDQPTGRYVDRDKLHSIDFDGRFFSVRGPSITPRPPQGQVMVALDATSSDAVAVAGRWANIAFVSATNVAEAASGAAAVRDVAAASGRDPGDVAVLAVIDAVIGADADARRARLDALAVRPDGDVLFTGTPGELASLMEDWFRSGAVDGFLLRPAVLPVDLTALVEGVVPALQAAGVFRRSYEAATLRERFGRPRPASRYATTGTAS